MDKADLFEVVVRTFGVLAFLRGLEKIAPAVMSAFGAFKPPAGYTSKDYVIASVPAFIVGVALLVWAENITGLFYS